MPATGVSRFGVLCGIALPGAALLAFAMPSFGQDTWGGSLAATTDYIYRGLSQTGGAPAVQGGLHARLPAGFAIGAWASTVDLNPGPSASLELDVYLMRSWAIGTDWDARVGVTHYEYPSDPRKVNYDYDEALVSLSFRRRITATVTWSPNTSGYGWVNGSANGSMKGSMNGSMNGWVTAREKTALSYEATYLQPLTESWSLNAGAGYYDLTELFDTGYWYWNTGIVYSRGALQFDVSRIEAEQTAADLYSYRAAGHRWSAALTWRF